ncbi:MAG: TRAP transporter small permease [Paracoccaceae bacterium]|nr:TRAP transporter small permease subunit [Rhodobacterales bacterium]NCW07154.1 TRAP transporter small permease subunit [Rhodobacterales bacterium]NDA30138.1 TRAP transporter small permease subunit [Alphaproteobacteria bacterium]
MNRIIENIRSISGVIASLLLVTMFGSFLLQIFFRYIMGWSVGWTIEYVSIAWLWIILFGYAFVVRENDVIKLDILYAYLPEKTKRVFDCFTNLICGMILILSLPKSIEYIEFMSIERTAYLRINFALLFSIYVPFAVVVSFRCLLNAWNALKGKGYEAEFEV